MNKKLILFSHHKVDKLTIDRFNNVKNLNPSWDVIPIGFDGYELLECSIVTNKEKYPSNKDIQYFASYNHIDWFDPDLFLYEGYIQKPNYDEYFLYEYDTASSKLTARYWACKKLWAGPGGSTQSSPKSRRGKY